MKVTTVCVGGWYQREEIHQIDFYRMLAFEGYNNGFMPEGFNKVSRKTLNVEKVDYTSDYIPTIEILSHIEDRKIWLYYESDGTTFVEEDVNREVDFDEIKGIIQTQEDFLTDRFEDVSRKVNKLAFGSYKDKVGKIMTTKSKSYCIFVKDATEEEIGVLFREFGDFVVKSGKGIYLGSKLAVADGDYNRVTASDATFILNFQATLQNSIYEHWNLWESIGEIRAHKKVKPKTLTKIRDKLFVLGQSTISKRNRINQMESYLKRRDRIMDAEDERVRKTVKEYMHLSTMNLFYLKEHWSMLQAYSDGTVELLTLMYSETQEKEMLFLQGLFLMGVVASLLALGAMPGATITMYNPAGGLVATGKLVSFYFRDLIMYGIVAVAATFLAYKLIRAFYEIREEKVE